MTTGRRTDGHLQAVVLDGDSALQDAVVPLQHSQLLLTVRRCRLRRLRPLAQYRA